MNFIFNEVWSWTNEDVSSKTWPIHWIVLKNKNAMRGGGGYSGSIPNRFIYLFFFFFCIFSKWTALLLLWFLTVTCSCCPYLYFGLPIMWVTYLGTWMTTCLRYYRTMIPSTRRSFRNEIWEGRIVTKQ